VTQPEQSSSLKLPKASLNSQSLVAVAVSALQPAESKVEVVE
jgi:hypothetical protein